MEILSHRGYWLKPEEKNTALAFGRSFELAFGTETDVRDCSGRLVISHDMPTGVELDFKSFLDIYGQSNLPLALNIKADGMALALKQLLSASRVSNFFVFDMSIPDLRFYLRHELPAFARMSEVEKEPAWLDQIQGIWLDSFTETWYNLELIRSLLNKSLKVCIVSSELHGRAHTDLWNLILPLASHPGLLLCTDFPEEARIFFKSFE